MINLPMIGKDGPETGGVMVRNRMQQGSVRLRKRKRGDVWTIRYRVRSTGGWIEKVEVLPKAKNESDARKALKRRMLEVNASNDPSAPAPPKNFAGFAMDWLAWL